MGIWAPTSIVSHGVPALDEVDFIVVCSTRKLERDASFVVDAADDFRDVFEVERTGFDSALGLSLVSSVVIFD
jgi:hypothetical protein